MRTAALVAAFLGWGLAAGFTSHSAPNISFIIGLAVGAGVMILDKGK